MNFLAFHKCLKKHDKHIPLLPCKKVYLAKLHEQQWVKEDFSKTFVSLSKIHAQLRGEIAPSEQDVASSFVRRTTKYWIKTCDISQVKHIILQHLPGALRPDSFTSCHSIMLVIDPCLVFQLNLDQLPGDSQLTNSAYLDNKGMDLYHGRIDKLPHAQAIRLRWYDLLY